MLNLNWSSGATGSYEGGGGKNTKQRRREMVYFIISARGFARTSVDESSYYMPTGQLPLLPTYLAPHPVSAAISLGRSGINPPIHPAISTARWTFH